MAKNSTQGTANTVRELIEPTVTELGYDIWDVEYVKEGADMHLRITIDSEDGIDIDDCEKVHRAIDPLIDKADPIEESYLLEVSSPGIERRLRTPEHFLACIGETVNLKLFAPIEGDERTKSKQIIAPMIAFDPETKNVTVEDGTENGLIVPWNLISRANIWYDFGD